ncbi:MAG: DNA cytosine methyltransferase [Oscillospiraceae bacterium]|jgi:DNA (cytosine-5)-methyltransferase 1|nr:DNA cytosine methyltransferase [Oscillospiraceae bacterium]
MTRELIIDNFAGGGGASIGIELAAGRAVDIAVNHDPDAIRMHRTNHPHTRHLCESVWDVDPAAECGGQPVGLAWFSPDCKHFSTAKGGKPVSKNIRGLAWVVLRWAATVRPRVIILENVEEFKTWGPVRRGKPVKAKAGQTFRRWMGQLTDLGYAIEHRELVAADYGAPTIRKRFFLVARCDGQPIRWPEPTHSKDGAGGLPKWRSAAEIIDWSLPCPSIFDTKEQIKARYGVNAIRPLAGKTLRRVSRGIDKFVIRSAEPFIIQCKFGNEPEDIRNPARTTTGVNAQLLAAPALIQYHSEKPTEYVRGQAADKPLLTVDVSNRYGVAAACLTEYYGSADGGIRLTDPAHSANAIVAAFVSKFYGEGIGQPANEPVHTVTQSPGHFGEVRTCLAKWDGKQPLHRWPEIRALLNTYCGYDIPDDTVLILRIGGADWFISDIGLRMLTPRELYNANGFPPDYIIERDYVGKVYNKTLQVARCGNAVPPPFAEALVRANLPEWCGERIGTMAELEGRLAG